MTSPHDAATIRVAIVEDDRITREGLSLIIAGSQGYECTQTFESVEDALGGIGANPPDVILLDIHLPDIPGSDGVRLLLEKYPSVQVLMLTNYAEEDMVFDSICNGAHGYLLKKTPPSRLLDAIREAREGGAPMSPEIARKVVKLFQKTMPPKKIEHRLTPHEIRILGMLAEGHSYQSVAASLSVSINTTRNHIRSIYEKLHVHSKSEAVGKALRHRVI